jgi:hypothetical protein
MPSIGLDSRAPTIRGALIFISHVPPSARSPSPSCTSTPERSPHTGDYDYLEKSNATSEREALVSPLNKTPAITPPAQLESRSGIGEIRQQRREVNAVRSRCGTPRTGTRARETGSCGHSTRTTAEGTRCPTRRPSFYADPAKPLDLNRELSSVTSELEATMRPGTMPPRLWHTG